MSDSRTIPTALVDAVHAYQDALDARRAADKAMGDYLYGPDEERSRARYEKLDRELSAARQRVLDARTEIVSCAIAAVG